MSNKIDTICIFSYPRSGSTWLKYILNSYDNVNIQVENNGYILDLCKSSIKLDAYNSMLNYDIHRNITDQRMFDLNIDMNLFRLNLKTFIEQNIFLKKENEICGWKEFNISPINFSENECISYLNEFKKIFTNSLFIFNVRDEVETSKSSYWKHVPDAVSKISSWKKMYENFYKENKNTSLYLDFDIWKTDSSLLYNILKEYNLKINESSYDNAFNTQMNYLKDY